MTTPLESVIVRIRAADGTVVGAGFLVGERHVLTCAHVVSRALDLPEETSAPPQSEVQLDFPLLPVRQPLTARVVHWQPVIDVAGLELTGQVPAEIEVVRLVTSDDWWEHPFRAFGFPAGIDEGVWASGLLRGKQANGWVQIEDVKQTGYFVQPGFSGGPVWDNELNGIAGMTVAAASENVRAAFIIPTDLLIKLWPAILETEIRLPFEPETILIPAGSFFMGGSPEDKNAEAWEFPVSIIYLPDYRIGKHPVTNEEYWEFTRESGYEVPQVGWIGRRPRRNKLNHPVVEVSWKDALAYCQWLSQKTGRKYRLPTESEWEKAARGSEDQRIYPWGNEWDPNRCNYDNDEITPVDAYLPQSPYGCYDMVGNVREWANTIWGSNLEETKSDFPYPWANDEREDPETDKRYSRVYRIYRGGSFNDSIRQLRCSARDWYAPDSRDKECGFRVVQEI